MYISDMGSNVKHVLLNFAISSSYSGRLLPLIRISVYYYNI